RFNQFQSRWSLSWMLRVVHRRVAPVMDMNNAKNINSGFAFDIIRPQIIGPLAAPILDKFWMPNEVPRFLAVVKWQSSKYSAGTMISSASVKNIMEIVHAAYAVDCENPIRPMAVKISARESAGFMFLMVSFAPVGI